MKFWKVSIFCVLISTGCHQSKDDQDDGNGIKKQIIGTWALAEGGFEWNIYPDGSFNSFFGKTNVISFYEGTWQSSNDLLYLTITNSGGSRKHETNGSIDKIKIIKLDATSLTTDGWGDTTIRYMRVK
jgi:hypothetical protein